MKISIITPSFNQAKYIERTILSIWNQKGNFDLEHIIADGGSTDGSVAIIKKYEQLYKSNEFKFNCRSFTFKWWSKKDNGQSYALNKGFSISTGEILGWLNSDDCFYTDGSLEAIHDGFIKQQTDIVLGNAHYIDENDQKLNQNNMLINSINNSEFQHILKKLLNYDFIVQPSCLFKRSIWEKYRINEDYHYVMDWALWIDAYVGNYTFYKINDYIGAYRIHSNAKTVIGGLEKYEEGLSIFRKYNVWCYNRLYHFIYLILLRIRKFSWFRPIIDLLIYYGKHIRNLMINKFKLY